MTVTSTGHGSPCVWPRHVTGADAQHVSSATLSAHESVRGRPPLHGLAVAVWIVEDDEPNSMYLLDRADLDRLHFYM